MSKPEAYAAVVAELSEWHVAQMCLYVQLPGYAQAPLFQDTHICRMDSGHLVTCRQRLP